MHQWIFTETRADGLTAVVILVLCVAVGFIVCQWPNLTVIIASLIAMLLFCSLFFISETAVRVDASGHILLTESRLVSSRTHVLAKSHYLGAHAIHFPLSPNVGYWRVLLRLQGRAPICIAKTQSKRDADQIASDLDAHLSGGHQAI